MLPAFQEPRLQALLLRAAWLISRFRSSADPNAWQSEPVLLTPNFISLLIGSRDQVWMGALIAKIISHPPFWKRQVVHVPAWELPWPSPGPGLSGSLDGAWVRSPSFCPESFSLSPRNAVTSSGCRLQAPSGHLPYLDAKRTGSGTTALSSCPWSLRLRHVNLPFLKASFLTEGSEFKDNIRSHPLPSQLPVFSLPRV